MFDLDNFVQECHGALEEATPIPAVADVVRRAVTDRTIEHVLTPDRSAYGVLHRCDALTVLHLGFPPTLGSSVHEHLMWAVVGIHRGQEDNTFFRHSAGGAPEPSGGRELRDGDVMAMGEDTVHAIRNPLRSYLSALHVYGGDLIGAPRREWDETGTSRPFDNDRALSAVAAVKAEEDRLGRPLQPDDIRRLTTASG